MGFYGENGEHTGIFFILIIAASVISATFSVANIYLVHAMKLWNGYILLILSMAWSQFIYDLMFAPAVLGAGYSFLFYIATILNVSSGFAVALFSNVMSITVLYVILFKESVDIFKNYKWYCLLLAIILVLSNTLYITSKADPSQAYLGDIALLDIYYYFRLGSIGLNFLSCGMSYLYVVRMDNMIGGSKTRQEVAICTLSTRMQYYPLVQAISRAGCAWYEFSYGREFNVDKVSQTQFLAQVAFAVLTPAASVGYFFIFITLQPRAYKAMMAILRGKRIVFDTKSHPATTRRSTGVFANNSNSLTPSGYDSNHLNTYLVPGHDASRHTMKDYSDEELCLIIDYDDRGTNIGSIPISDTTQSGYHSGIHEISSHSTSKLGDDEPIGILNPLFEASHSDDSNL